MLLTIHNLPSHIQYANVRLLIQSQCGIKADDMILDNLVNEGRSKKVTVGLVGEKQAEILKRKINGMLIEGQQLCVKDLGEKQAGNDKRNSSSGYQKNDSPSQPSQAYQSQAQQGYPTNLNQYQPNYGQGNQPYMSQEQMIQMQLMMMNTQMGIGGVGYMPVQNPYMDYSGQMQSKIAAQYSNNQQKQNVDSAKKDDRSASTTKNWGRDDYEDNDRYQNKGDGDRSDSRKYDRDDEYNNHYQDDQYASKKNDRDINERSRSWGRDEHSRYNEESYQNHSCNQPNQPPWDTDRERQQRSYNQSGRDSRSRSRSPYYYEDRERAVSRNRYQDTGRPDSSYQRKDSAYTAVASTSRQYGDGNPNSQRFTYVDLYEPASECNDPKSSDRENQSVNRWDHPDNPLPRSRYRWNKQDRPSNPLPQSGSRWDKPDNPLPQSRGAQPQGNRWDKPNNQSPQSGGAQPQGDRWDKPNNQSAQGRGAHPQGDRWDKPNYQLPLGRGAQPQGDRWDKPNNQSAQGRGAQSQGDRWGKSSTTQPREPQRPASPKRNLPKPIIWEDHNPSSVKIKKSSVKCSQRRHFFSSGNIHPLMQNTLVQIPPPPQTSKKILHTPQPQNKRNKGIAQFVSKPLKTDFMYREMVACMIAAQICKQGLPTQDLRIRKRIKKSIRREILARMELVFKDEKVGRESERKYREHFPTSTDREMLEKSYELIAKKPLPPAPDADGRSNADPSGAASTSVEETTQVQNTYSYMKVEPVEDVVSLKPDEPIVTVVEDEPKNVEAEIVDKEIKLETPVVQSIPEQVAPTIPAVPQIAGKLPKYPNGDKQAYKDNKKLAAKEFESESGYTLDPVLKDVIKKELAPITAIFRNELKRSESGEESRLCQILTQQAVKFEKCLNLHVTKRLLDIRTNLILRVFVHGKTPHQSQIESLLKPYGVISLKKSVKQGPLYYIAECSNYEGYDQLQEIRSFSQGTKTTLVIKPFHVAGPLKKPLRKKNQGRGKGSGWRR